MLATPIMRQVSQLPDRLDDHCLLSRYRGISGTATGNYDSGTNQVDEPGLQPSTVPWDTAPLSRYGLFSFSQCSCQFFTA